MTKRRTGVVAVRWFASGVLAAALGLGGSAGAQPRPAKARVVKPNPAAQKAEIAAAVAALRGTDLESAARAADTLGKSDASAAHEALLDELVMGLTPAVASPALSALALHPAPPDVATLRFYAGHHNAAVRTATLGALAMYPNPDARAAIVAGLHDGTATVRAAAAAAAATGHVRDAVEPLLQLMAKGEEPAARALAAMADLDLARKLADQLGKVPEPTLALALGALLKRADFGPDPARVEVVRALAKIQDRAALAALADYIAATPKTPPRDSRAEAEGVIQARVGGGDQ